MSIKKKIDVCLVVDHSGSLSKEGDMINDSLVAMLAEIKNTPYLHGCDVYFTLVSFDNEMTKNVDFVPLNSVSPSSLILKYDYQTNPGPALEYVVETAYKRYYDWRNSGEDAFHPLIFFFTDGSPYPVEKYMPAYKKIAERIRQLEKDKKLVIVCSGYGNANIENLNLLTEIPERVLQMSGNRVDKLSRFFKEIIPQTITSTVTGTFDQMADVFRFFTLS